jgi:hypothetical protein
MARDVRNDIDKTSLSSRRRRRGPANSTSDSNQTNRQQLQALHDMTADSPPIHESDLAGTTAPTLSPGSPNSHACGNTSKLASISPNYGRSYSPECACHRLTECPGLLDVGSLSSRKSDSSVSANWRRTFIFNLFFFSSLSDHPTSCI